MADFPPFAFTTQESWYGELSFKSAEDGSAVPLTGRQFEMHITPASSGAQLVPPVVILTMEEGRGLSLKAGDPGTIVFRVPRTVANAFPRGDYTGDVLEVVGGERYLFMPVRITYAEPSGLRSYLSRFLGVGVSFASRQQPIYTPLAVPGREGRPGATILRGTVPPVPADGKDGDFFIEDRTASGQGRRMWGPKAGGQWPGTPWNIQVARYTDVPGLTEALDVIEFPNLAAAQAATIPASKAFVRLAGAATAGDRGAGLYRRLTTGPSNGVWFASADGALWELAETYVSLQQGGAVDDGLTPADTAFARVRSTARTIRLPRTVSGRYRFTESPGFTERTLDPDPDVALAGPVNFDPTLRTRHPIRLHEEREGDGGAIDRYDYWFMPEWGDLPARKKVWLSGGDVDTSTVEAIDCSTALAFRKVFANTSDDWIADTVTAGAADYVPFGLTTDGNWHAGFLPVRGGDELFATFDPGQYVRGVFVRTTNGYHVFKAGDTGLAAFSTKIIGQPQETIENVGWFDVDINPAWQTNFAEYGLRLVDSRRIDILLNGTEVFRRRLTGEVIEAGFGALFDRSGVATVRSLSRVRTRQAVGVRPLNLLIVGDSRLAHLHGSADFWIKDALDGSLGILVQSIDNRAVPGETSGEQLARLQAQGFQNSNNPNITANCLVIGVGTNDGQTLTPVSTMVANVRAKITLAKNNFIPVVLVGFDLWYAKGTGPAETGVTTYASNLSAPYRSALRRLAGETGVRYVDLSKHNAMYRSLVNADDRITDPRARDRLHHTAYAYRVNAVAIAQAITAEVAPRMTQKVNDAPFPLVGPFNCLRNGWTATTAPPTYSISEDGFLTARMTLDAGSGAVKANGTAIFQVPPNLLPSAAGGAVRLTGWNENGFVRLVLDGSGRLLVFDMGGSSLLAFTLTYRLH
ncbi:SGNH/GDSL hydrolase family protein [Methylorubrum extorquens]